MTAATRWRLAIVMDHPAQHFAPAFRALASSAVLDPVVIYGDSGQGGVDDPGFGRTIEWDVDLLDGYPWWAPPGRSGGVAARATIGQLGRSRPQLVLCFGWATPIARLTLVWALATRTPLLVYGDSTWQHERSGLAGMARSAALRLVFARAGALSTGTFNREFYLLHGMAPWRICPGVCPADVEHYRHAFEAETQPSVPLLIGFAGKLIARKGVHELLSALALLPAGSWRAEIAGDGPERDRLQALAHQLGIAERVNFRGFVNQSEMPAFLAACDVVVVPSTLDMRVLVVIEAMAAGAAVVVSSNTAVWGSGDLVEHGETGLVYRSGDPGDLAGCLRWLLADVTRIGALRDAASAQIDAYGPEAFRARLEAAVAHYLD